MGLPRVRLGYVYIYMSRKLEDRDRIAPLAKGWTSKGEEGT